MRTPAQRGPIGNWLRDERLARGWTSAAVARSNLERAGIVVAQSVYAEWESGTRLPSERHLEQLKRYYGTTPASEAAHAQDAVAAAIDRQTEVLARQVEALGQVLYELRAIRGVSGALADNLGVVIGALKPEALDTLLQPAAHTETDTK